MLVKFGNKIVQPRFQMTDNKEVMLCEDYEFFYNGKSFIIKSGFTFDGATIPRFLWSILGICPFGWVLPAALKHDYIYVLEGKLDPETNIPRKWVDIEFVKDILELKLINNNFIGLYKFILRIAGLYYWFELY